MRRFRLWWDMRGLIRHGIVERHRGRYTLTDTGVEVAKGLGMVMVRPEDFRR